MQSAMEKTPMRPAIAVDMTTVAMGDQQKRSTVKQVLFALIAYSASLAPSMSIGFSAVAIPALIQDKQFPFTTSQASWFASVASIATPLGCLVSGPASDRLGRKAVLLMVNLVAFLGWIVIAIGMDLKSQRFGVLILGRLLTGFSTGFASMPPVVYMSEVASAKLRGVFTTANGVFFAIGILTVYVLGAFFPDNCGMVAVITAVLPCISMVSVVFLLPETAQWLVTRGRIDEASNNLVRIYGYREYNKDIYDDIQTMIAQRDARQSAAANGNGQNGTSTPSKWRMFLQPTCYKPFFIVQTFFFFQQFSGTFVIVFYAISIVQEAGVSIDHYLAIVVIAFVRLLGALLVAYISRHWGRRPISIFSGLGMTLCMCIQALYLYFDVSTHTWIPFACLLIYFFTSTLGFITMPFAMAAECFAPEIKGTVTGLITCMAYVFNFIIVKIYPNLIETLGSHGTFLFYGIVSFLGTVFVYLCLPETRGKTLQQIQQGFDRKVRIDANGTAVVSTRSKS